MSPQPAYQRVDDEKTRKKTPYAWPISYIGRSTHPMEATSGFHRIPGPPQLGDQLGIVLADCHGQWNCWQIWSFLSFFSGCDSDPVICRRDTERILTQWWRPVPVALSEALDPLHWSMKQHRSSTSVRPPKRVTLEVHSLMIHHLLQHVLQYWILGWQKGPLNYTGWHVA